MSEPRGFFSTLRLTKRLRKEIGCPYLRVRVPGRKGSYYHSYTCLHPEVRPLLFYTHPVKFCGDCKLRR